MIRSRVLFIVATLAVCAFVVHGTESSSSSSSSGSTTSSSSGSAGSTPSSAGSSGTTSSSGSAGSTPSSAGSAASSGSAGSTPSSAGSSGSTATSGSDGSSSSHPLPAVCEMIDCRCLHNATFASLSIQRVTPVLNVNEAITASAVVDYRQCNINYNVVVRFEWKLFNGAQEVALTGITANKLSLTLPANFMDPQITYTLRLTATGHRDETEESTLDFAVVVPPPTVLLNGQSRLMRTGPTNIEIPASITVAHGSVLTATWSCIMTGSDDACPQSMSLSQATNEGVTITGPVAAGNYTVTLTYEGIERSLDLVVVATAVPKVTVDALTVPVAQPLKYAYSLSNLQLSFLAVVESNEAITGIVWTLNGETLTATERTIDLNESHVVSGSNTLSVRAMTASDYGEASVEFVLSAQPTLTLSAITNLDGDDTVAVSLKERISTTATPSVTTIFDVPLTYAVRYDDTRQGETVSQGIASPVVNSNTNTITFVAPLPTTDAATLVVTFRVDLLLGTHVVATASRTFNLQTITKSEAADLQLAELKTGGVDIAKVIKFLSNAGFMSDPDVKAAIVAEVVALFSSALTEALSEEQTDLIVRAILYLVTADTADDVLALMHYLTLNAKSAAILADAVASAIEAGATASQTINATNKVAFAFLSAGTIGEEMQLTSGGFIITGTPFVQTGAEVSVNGQGGSITMSSDGIAGLPTGKKFVVLVIKIPKFPAQAGVTTNSDVISFEVAADGATVPVSGLTTLITLRIATTSPATDECRYFNTATGLWDTTGLTKQGYDATHIICETSHLTPFAAVEGTVSGAISVAVSAVAVLVAVIAQLAM